MRGFLWFGIFFLSASWLFFIPIFYPEDLLIGAIFLLLGIGCIFLGMPKKDNETDINKKYILFTIPLLLAIALISFPYNLGLILITLGFLIYILYRPGWIGKGVFLSGALLVIQTIVYPFYLIFTSINHQVDFLAPFVNYGIHGLGLTSATNNGLVFVQSSEYTYPFIVTLENLGFYLWLNLLIGAFILLIFFSERRKIRFKILGFFILSGIYLILRFITLIFIYMYVNVSEIFWNPLSLVISFIPFVLLLTKFFPLNHFKIEFQGFEYYSIKKNRVIASLMIFLFVFFIVGAAGFQDPGSKKEGKILFDETHSNWESTLKKIDKEWYGELSTYNYYSWAEWLNYYYHVEKNINATITPDLLNNYDILIIKCPTSYFSDEEVQAIIQFVENGGGLFLIGDHTNVLGMNFYLNQIAKKFGMEFNYDATSDLKTGMFSVYKPPQLLPHPIMQWTPQYMYLTSCSLKAPLTAEMVMIGYSLIGEPGTFSTQYFFREGSLESKDQTYGLLLQSAALKYGKGRVVAFTDSTDFSNFCVFLDGYQTYSLGVMDYLNRTNLFDSLNTFFTLLALISFGFFFYFVRKEQKILTFLVAISIGAFSYGAAATTFSYFNKVNYPLPVFHSDFNKICFVEDHSDVIISTKYVALPEAAGYAEKRFDTFFIWTQRINCISSVEKTLNDAINKGDIIVFINPIQSFSTEDIDDITSYVKNGGNVLLMDGVLNTKSTANDLLLNYGMQILREAVNHTIQSGLNTTDMNDTLNVSTIGNTATPYITIGGGQKVYVTGNNKSCISVVKFGAGKIVVVVDSYMFSTDVMGISFTIPDETLLQIYNTEFYIFEKIFLEKN